MTAETQSAVGELHVTAGEEKLRSASGVRVIDIREVIGRISNREYDEMYSIVSNAEVETDLPIPLYEIAWVHLLSSRKGRLLELLLFYRSMREIIGTEQPDLISCGPEVDRGYSAVLLDLGQEYGVEVSNAKRPPCFLSFGWRWILSSILLIPFLLDQMLSLAYRLGRSVPQSAESVVIPPLGRLDSMVPVIERIPFDPALLVHSNGGSWFWQLARDGLDNQGALPLSVYGNVQSLRRQLGLYVSICRHVFFSNRLKNQIRKILESEFDMQTDRTIDYAVLGAFRTRLLISFLLYELFGAVVESLEPAQVVLGTLSPEGKAMVARSVDDGVDTFHVPHSVATWQSPNPRPELTQFVAGDLDTRYYQESTQVQDEWDMVVTGRPYLTDLYAAYASEWREPTATDVDGIRLLVATQPFAESQEFVADVIDASNDCQRRVEIFVKPHPNEDPGRYDQFDADWVSVVSGDLFQLLEGVDLSITISSNVGLESVFVGTPTVCYNRWEPIRQPPVYARYGVIEVVRDVAALSTFFDASSPSSLDELHRDQTEFIAENYVLEEDAARNIADHLESNLESRAR